ncbi:MAG: hypothetical protein ACXU9U_00275 [Parachlamydiaceae bacterium]
MLIFHQDRHLTTPMLQEISKVFREALKWNRKQPIVQLRNTVGLIRYLFSHAMPFSRGSATIGEWIEKIIYNSHGFKFEHKIGTKGDLEALTAPLWSTFITEKYHTTISLS